MKSQISTANTHFLVDRFEKTLKNMSLHIQFVARLFEKHI